MPKYTLFKNESSIYEIKDNEDYVPEANLKDLIEDIGSCAFVDALNDSIKQKHFDDEFTAKAVTLFNDKGFADAVDFVIENHPELLESK
jgi:hypothetical protein